MAKKRKDKHPPKDSDPLPEVPSYASIYPGLPTDYADAEPVAPETADCVRRLEAELDMSVWLLVQSDKFADGNAPFCDINSNLVAAFFQSRLSLLREGEPIALMVYSPGGIARYAYELAMLLRRHCGGFVAIIPRYAKSAATLLTLGADAILMNIHAELGPLDAQIYDPEREEGRRSALDEVQTLEQLSAFAMQVFDDVMPRFVKGTDKKMSSLMPLASDFVTRLVAPLFDKIDVVRYTQVSRELKIAEEYAKRLLDEAYGQEAERISRFLNWQYPEHEFPIYSEEARKIGLRVTTPADPVRSILEEMTVYLRGTTLIGRIVTRGS